MKTLLLLLTLGVLPTLQAQDFPELDKSPMDMAYYPERAAFRNFAETEAERKAGEPVVRVVYSRPQKKERVVFGELIKYGEMWRIGANEATEITFFQDVKFGNQPVKAGRYTMYAQVEEGEWTVYLSLDLDGWGHYAFKPEESSVAQVTVPVMSTPDTIEALSMLFEKSDDGVHLVIGWDNTMARVPIQL